LLISLIRIYIKNDGLDWRNEKLLAYVMTRKWMHLIEREYVHAICIHCAGAYDPWNVRQRKGFQGYVG